jgi:muramoyltetrapeptide carboxypeptidase
LFQLLHAGVLARQKAVILGDFSGYRLSEYDNGYDFEAMLAGLRSLLSVPLLQGLPFGHTKDKLTLPVGAVCRVRSDPTGLQLSLSDYPGLRN